MKYKIWHKLSPYGFLLSFVNFKRNISLARPNKKKVKKGELYHAFMCQ
jgi:hypothetical protein